jgi:hypothetical protein
MAGTDVARTSDPWAAVLAYLGLDPQTPETRALVLLCDRYGLDPLLGHASIIGTRGAFRPYITRDGMLEVAHRSGQLDGIVVDELRRNSTGDGWTAYVSVWRKDMSHPFRWGAQCKDREAVAKQGHGPEMALARAERRALKHAFNIPLADEDAEVRDVDVETVTEPVPELEDVPSEAEQRAAHAAVAAWTQTQYADFLARHNIGWNEPWPNAAVVEAIEEPF